MGVGDDQLVYVLSMEEAYAIVYGGEERLRELEINIIERTYNGSGVVVVFSFKRLGQLFDTWQWEYNYEGDIPPYLDRGRLRTARRVYETREVKTVYRLATLDDYSGNGE